MNKKKHSNKKKPKTKPITSCYEFQNEVETYGKDGRIKNYKQCMQECFSHEPTQSDTIYCGLDCECDPFCEDHYLKLIFLQHPRISLFLERFFLFCLRVCLHNSLQYCVLFFECQ